MVKLRTRVRNEYIIEAIEAAEIKGSVGEFIKRV